ncbi:Fanconi anemia core complex-associated protein 100 isoform X1 [Hypanus sabinus]|uniref:Fanconi anemia core complex-associated protein 100 isoform X1 n=1 Tax=Hypanus sabinus TaxID=79690 RepID=UPI0028C47795|nr:Fanconi anemia core complex-associated protein 100 isoform X1 [Hypanus sabinus]
MAGFRAKSICYWDQIKPVQPCGGRRGARGSVGLLASPPRVCVCNCSEFIYIYHASGSLEVVYKLPSTVWQVELDRRGEQLFVLCDGGGIYSILLKKNSRMPETVGQKLPPDLSPSGSDSDCGPPSVCTVGAEHCLVRDCTVCSFVGLDKDIVVVAEEEQNWKIRTFRLPTTGSEDQMCQKIEEIGFTSHLNSPHCEKSEPSYPPVFLCVYPHVEKEQKDGEDYTCLDASVFALLFNVDASLLLSPIVLCGLPDGQVYVLPMRYTRSEAKGHPPRMTVLLHLEQPVVFIGLLTLKREVSDDQDPQPSRSKPQIPNSIVVIGKEGKVVIIKSSLRMETWSPCFTEYHLQGPIISACSHASTLYYSTRSDFYGVEILRSENFSGRLPDGESGQAGGALPSILLPVSLNICGVVAVSRPSLTAEGDVNLVALTEKGKVMACTLPHPLSAAPTPKLQPACTGQRIKDLLSGISNVSDRISSLKGIMQQKDKALKGLNQDFNICCALLSDQDKVKESSKQSFSCSITTKWNHVLLQDSLVISVVLKNLSDWSLQHRWFLCVQLVAQNLVLAKVSDSTAFSYAFLISELPPREKMEVAIPLNSEDDGLLLLPVTVHCFLYYNLNTLNMTTASRLPVSPRPSLPFAPSESDGVCLPLNTRVIDLLDCLHIHGGGATGTIPHLNHRRTTLDTLEMFLRSAMCSEGKDIRGDRTVNSPFGGLCNDRVGAGPFTASFKVSSELMEVPLKDISTGNMPENGSNVLQWLLCTNPELEALRMQPVPAVHCTAPDGSRVRILTKQVEVSGFSVDGPITVTEIVLECSSLTVFCFLHQALARRVQMLLEQSSPCSGSLPGLHMQSLRQLAHSAETLLKGVQSLRDQLCLGEEVNRSGAAGKLLQLYEQLRSIDLVIV